MNTPERSGNAADLLAYASELPAPGRSTFKLDHVPSFDELDEFAQWAGQMSPNGATFAFDDVEEVVIITVF